MLRSLARRLAAMWASAIVVLTERDADAWKERFGLKDKVISIKNPLPKFLDSHFQPISEREKFVLAVGRVTFQKGYDVLLNAWSLVGCRRQTWKLRIVGGGDDELKIKQLAQKLNITDSVTFVGQIKNVGDEYRRASIYVMASRWEGLPMALIEAQYFGLACVSTDCETGPREILKNGCGLLVPVENPALLADAIALLISDAELRQMFSVAAQDNSKLYDSVNIIKSWELLFKRVLS